MLISACNNDDLSATDLEVTVNDNSLTLQNNANESIYYFVVDRNALTLISWAPIVDNEIEIKSGDSIELLFLDITGFSNDTEEFSVNFWGAAKEDGEIVPDEIFKIIVSIN